MQKEQNNYHKRLSNILIKKRTKRYKKKSGIREEAKSREKERDRERLREREKERERERLRGRERERKRETWKGGMDINSEIERAKDVQELR